MSAYHLFETPLYTLNLSPTLTEKRILDVGGGGEGVIGRLYQERVTAIDRLKDTLLETRNRAVKCVADAQNMPFLEETFDAVTSFYTMMYMDKTERFKSLKEIHRVLVKGGRFYIWDIEMPPAESLSKTVFVANIELNFTHENTSVKTGYGVAMSPSGLSYESLLKVCTHFNFTCIEQHLDGTHYHLVFEKA